MAQSQSEPRGFLSEVKLVYIREYREPGTGIAGSLYRTAFADGQERYYFFANEDLPGCEQRRQRQVIAFDGAGRVVHTVAAGYARAPK